MPRQRDLMKSSARHFGWRWHRSVTALAPYCLLVYWWMGAAVLTPIEKTKKWISNRGALGENANEPGRKQNSFWQLGQRQEACQKQRSLEYMAPKLLSPWKTWQSEDESNQQQKLEHSTRIFDEWCDNDDETMLSARLDRSVFDDERSRRISHRSYILHGFALWNRLSSTNERSPIRR